MQTFGGNGKKFVMLRVRMFLKEFIKQKGTYVKFILSGVRIIERLLYIDDYSLSLFQFSFELLIDIVDS